MSSSIQTSNAWLLPLRLPTFRPGTGSPRISRTKILGCHAKASPISAGIRSAQERNKKEGRRTFPPFFFFVVSIARLTWRFYDFLHLNMSTIPTPKPNQKKTNTKIPNTKKIQKKNPKNLKNPKNAVLCTCSCWVNLAQLQTLTLRGGGTTGSSARESFTTSMEATGLETNMMPS